MLANNYHDWSQRYSEESREYSRALRVLKTFSDYTETYSKNFGFNKVEEFQVEYLPAPLVGIRFYRFQEGVKDKMGELSKPLEKRRYEPVEIMLCDCYRGFMENFD